MTNKVLGIIPARAGSKGLPGKNLRNLNGKPLIYWSIDAALQSDCIDDVIVTSDSIDALSLASKMGVGAIRRPANLADDRASMIGVVEHVIEILKEQGKQYTHLCLLQPTSPLRNFTHIDAAYAFMKENAADSVISVTAQQNACLKWFVVEENGKLSPAAYDKSFPFSTRQELPNVCSANGAIYIISVNEFLVRRLFVTASTAAFYMDDEASIDIDTEAEFIQTEKYFKNAMKNYQ